MGPQKSDSAQLKLADSRKFNMRCPMLLVWECSTC